MSDTAPSDLAGAPAILWTPPADRVRASRMHGFMRRAEARSGRSFGSYEDLWRWSVEDLSGFW